MLTFFNPKQEFFDWVSTYINGRNIIDAGCGNGTLVKELDARKYHVLGIDLYPPPDLMPYPLGLPIIEADAISFDYPTNSVVIFARPNRGAWLHLAMKRALKNNCEIVYIGKKEHYEEDITPLHDWKDYNLEIQGHWKCDDKDWNIILSNFGDEKEIITTIRKKTIFEQIDDWHRTDNISEPIPVYFGCGLKFMDSVYDSELKDYVPIEAVTLQPKLPRKVEGKITSWKGSIGAVHHYAKLYVAGVDCQFEYKGKIKTHWTSKQPKESCSFELEVRTLAKKDMYSWSMFAESEDGKTLMTKKGGYTHQYETEEEALKALKSEYKRIFKDDWELIIKE